MIARKIAYNIVFVGITKLISIGLAFYAIKLLTHHLGTELYGKYTVALAFLGLLMAVADMGLHSITTREISREEADENTIINKIFSLRLLITGTVFLLSLLLVGFLPYDDEVKSAIFVISGAFLFSSTYSLLNSVFQKHTAMDRVAMAELVGKLIQMGIIIALVKLELPFIYSVIAIFAAMVSNFLLIFLLARKYVKITLEWDPLYWKSFLLKSLPLGISAFATFLYFKVDTILLSFMVSDTDVGIYGAAYKIIETLVFFPAMVIGLVLPLLSRYIESDEALFHKTTTATIKFFVVLLIPAIVSLYFLAPWIISVLSGEEFASSADVLQIITFTLIGIFFGHLFMSIAIAGNLQKMLMKILLATAFVNIGLNLLLIPHFSYTGAAITSVITEIFVMGVVLWAISKYTAFQFTLKGAHLHFIATALIVGVNLIAPFHVFVTAILAVIVYFAFVFASKIISPEDLAAIRPSTKD